MTLTTSNRNGTGKGPHLGPDHRFEELLAVQPQPAKVLEAPPSADTVLRNGMHHDRSWTLALVCHEYPETAIGQYVAQLARALARRGAAVHLFSRRPFLSDVPGVHDHAVGDGQATGLIEEVDGFTRRVCQAFLEQFPNPSQRVMLWGQEWSSIPALELLRAERSSEFRLSLSSLERQRSDMQSALSQQIEQIEQTGMREAASILVQQPAVGEIARHWTPECAAKLHSARQPFPVQPFDSRLDPGVVKARFQIGPVDPTVLFVGNMDERHGPDVLMKSIPAILRNHKQARFVFVGDGSLWWPMRVHARYLLLEHDVRLVGHMEGQPLYDLIQAADVVVVPSREQTEWWPIQAAWAARRAVVASHPAAASLIEHERDGILVYPHESSLVWGVERLLFDSDLLRRIAAAGHEKLEARFGWNGVAQQIEELLSVTPSVA